MDILIDHVSEKIETLEECFICCSENPIQRKIKCCSNILCSKCLARSATCPFCRSIIVSKDTVKSIMEQMINAQNGPAAYKLGINLFTSLFIDFMLR